MVDVMHPVTVADSIADRLSAAKVAHRDALEVAAKTSALVNALVVEAIDAGMSYGAVAALVGVTKARIHHIVLNESRS